MSHTVEQHHKEQFGKVPVERLLTKLLEESGELAGATIRHLERRDGREWRAEMESELGDVLVVLNTIAARMGLELTAVNRRATDRFVSRIWPGVKKYHGDNDESE